MARKRDFKVKITDAGGNVVAEFAGNACQVKHKRFLTRIGLTDVVEETISCEDAKITKKNPRHGAAGA